MVQLHRKYQPWAATAQTNTWVAFFLFIPYMYRNIADSIRQRLGASCCITTPSYGSWVYRMLGNMTVTSLLWVGEVHAPLGGFLGSGLTGKGRRENRTTATFATSHFAFFSPPFFFCRRNEVWCFQLHESAVIIIIMSCFKSPQNASSTAAPIKKS